MYSIGTKDAAAACFAKCSIYRSKKVSLAVFHQGFYPLVPSAGRGLSHSSQGSRWVGDTQWVRRGERRRRIEDVGGWEGGGGGVEGEVVVNEKNYEW